MLFQIWNFEYQILNMVILWDFSIFAKNLYQLHTFFYARIKPLVLLYRNMLKSMDSKRAVWLHLMLKHVVCWYFHSFDLHHCFGFFRFSPNTCTNGTLLFMLELKPLFSSIEICSNIIDSKGAVFAFEVGTR